MSKKRKIQLYGQIPTDFGGPYRRELIESYDRERENASFGVFGSVVLILTVLLIAFAFMRDVF